MASCELASRTRRSKKCRLDAHHSAIEGLGGNGHQDAAEAARAYTPRCVRARCHSAASEAKLADELKVSSWAKSMSVVASMPRPSESVSPRFKLSAAATYAANN